MTATPTPASSASDLAETLALVETISSLASQAGARLSALLGQDSGLPVLDASTAARVERLGEVAHLHLQHLEQTRSLTRKHSLAIRRALYGGNVRSTANLFGRKGSGALFWRDRPYKAPVADNDPIRLTEEGERIARLWRQLHPGVGTQTDS